MKILAMADLHGDLDIYRQLKKLIERHDTEAVILAGDLLAGFRGDLPIEAAQGEDARQIIEMLKSLKRNEGLDEKPMGKNKLNPVSEVKPSLRCQIRLHISEST